MPEPLSSPGLVASTVTSKYPERSSDPTIALRWLSEAGNDERKLLAVLALNESEGALTGTTLKNTLSGLAGEALPGTHGTYYSYLEKSLLEAGAVCKTTARLDVKGFGEREATAFEITDEGKTFGVPFAGALLDWSLTHPNLSLRQLLGANNKSGQHNTKSPLHRFWLLYDLASYPNDREAPSIASIAPSSPVNNRVKRGAIERLHQYGAVDRTAERPGERQFRIIAPDYDVQPGQKTYDELTGETQLTLSAIKKALDIKDVWTINDFAEFMNNLGDPDLVAKARGNLQQIFSDTRHSSFLRACVEPINKEQAGHGENVRVGLNDTTIGAIRDLVAVIDSFYTGELAVIERGRLRAQQIIQSPDDISELFKKGVANSNYKSSDAHIGTAITNILDTSATGLTVKEVRDRYAQLSGRQVTTTVIYGELDKLLKASVIDIDQRIVSINDHRRHVGFYTLSAAQKK